VDADPAVVVVDAWQGRGIGTVLVRLAVARWKAASVETLHVEILAGNTASNRLMRSLSGNRAAAASHTGFRSPGRQYDGFAEQPRIGARPHRDRVERHEILGFRHAHPTRLIRGSGATVRWLGPSRRSHGRHRWW
jgi:GNAT superfamily N-acetyltransferase